MLHYEIVDVFTDLAFTGNPLAVVLDADDLSTPQLQALAREFNLSETAFPLPSTVADYRLRIFTPLAELPFAGHPSVGAAHTLARLGRIDHGAVVQECGAGLLPLHVEADAVRLTGGTPAYGDPLDHSSLLRAAGLEDSDFGGTPPRLAGCGLQFGYLHVRAAAVARADPAPGALAAANAVGQGGLSVLAWDAEARTAHARVFAPGVGVAEDPATGSAALGLGVWLVTSGLLPGDGVSSYTVKQGAELLRPSILRCTVAADTGAVTQTTVSGNVVPVAAGTIRRPDPRS